MTRITKTTQSAAIADIPAVSATTATQPAAHAVDRMAAPAPAAKTTPLDPAVTVPDGGESMTPADIQRLAAIVLQLNTTKVPDKLPITRAQVEARLPFLLSDPEAVRFVRDDGRDFMEFAGFRCELADKALYAGKHAPTERIAACAKSAPADKPLQGLRIALDSGHFGFVEDMIEGKFVTKGPPPTDRSSVPADGVTEGEITVMTARNVARRLEELGASVTLTRQGAVSRSANREHIAAFLKANPELDAKVPDRAIFLTSLDLERRAERLSAPTPDMVIAMHFDAEQHEVTPSARKEVKIYVPGAFTKEGLAGGSQQCARFASQLGNRSWDASVQLAKTLVQSIAAATDAVPQLPSQTGAVNPKFLRPIGNDTGVFGRNLRMPAAVRGEPLSCYLEGATYNHPAVYDEVMRDKGTRFGQPGGFIDRYAKSIADGIVAFVAIAK